MIHIYTVLQKDKDTNVCHFFGIHETRKTYLTYLTCCKHGLIKSHEVVQGL